MLFHGLNNEGRTLCVKRKFFKAKSILFKAFIALDFITVLKVGIVLNLCS